MNSMDIIWLCVFLVGLVLTIISGFWAYKVSQNYKIRSGFNNRNKEGDSIWGFTKRNFPLFLSLFFVVIAITGLGMLIQ